VGGPFGGNFHDQSDEDVEKIVRMNIYPALMMSRIVLPQMINRTARSAIINVGSFSGIASIPTQVVNSGAKNFVQGLNNALAAEYSDTKVDFLTVIPGLVQTEALENWKGKKMLVSSPEEVVECALRDVKMAKIVGNVSYGTRKHRVFQGLLLSGLTRKYMIKYIYGLEI